MIRTLMFLLALLGPFTQCAQEKSKRTEQTSNIGLLIDNGINRGINYTDSLGANYNLRYIPISITNDSTIPIHFQLAFSKDYDYSIAYEEEKFKVIPLPKEWGLNGVEISDSMFNELKNYIDKPLLNETVEPGEKCVVAIGTLYPRPPKFSGILPNALFAHTDKGIFSTCDWLMNEDPSSNPQIALGLKLDFGGNCMVIPCGQISFVTKESN